MRPGEEAGFLCTFDSTLKRHTCLPLPRTNHAYSTRTLLVLPWPPLAGLGHAAITDAHCGTTMAATTTGAGGSATWNCPPSTTPGGTTTCICTPAGVAMQTVSPGLTPTGTVTSMVGLCLHPDWRRCKRCQLRCKRCLPLHLRSALLHLKLVDGERDDNQEERERHKHRPQLGLAAVPFSSLAGCVITAWLSVCLASITGAGRTSACADCIPSVAPMGVGAAGRVPPALDAAVVVKHGAEWAIGTVSFKLFEIWELDDAQRSERIYTRITCRRHHVSSA